VAVQAVTARILRRTYWLATTVAAHTVWFDTMPGTLLLNAAYFWLQVGQALSPASCGLSYLAGQRACPTGGLTPEVSDIALLLTSSPLIAGALVGGWRST
jgi:hypothetical protein